MSKSSKPEKLSIDILGTELEKKSSHWLIPTLTMSDRRAPNRGGRWT
jgi:hypothetical protein